MRVIQWRLVSWCAMARRTVIEAATARIELKVACHDEIRKSMLVKAYICKVKREER